MIAGFRSRISSPKVTTPAGTRTVFSSTGAIGKPGEGPTGRAELTKYWDYYYGDKGPLSRVFQTSLDQHIEVDSDTATQESNQIIVFEFHGRPPVFGISRRKNHLVRTPERLAHQEDHRRRRIHRQHEPANGPAQ